MSRRCVFPVRLARPDGGQEMAHVGHGGVESVLLIGDGTFDQMLRSADLRAAVDGLLGQDADPAGNSAILKDEERCIRCALCVMRCPVDAIAMERVRFSTEWRCA